MNPQPRPQTAYVPPKLPSTRDTIARGQKDDAPTVRIPTPTDLGIASATIAEIDWKMVERRMNAARVSRFDISKDNSGFQCVCQVGTRDVVAHGSTRAEAVLNAVKQLPH